MRVINEVSNMNYTTKIVIINYYYNSFEYFLRIYITMTISYILIINTICFHMNVNNITNQYIEKQR